MPSPNALSSIGRTLTPIFVTPIWIRRPVTQRPLTSADIRDSAIGQSRQEAKNIAQLLGIVRVRSAAVWAWHPRWAHPATSKGPEPRPLPEEEAERWRPPAGNWWKHLHRSAQPE